ncbi:cellular tumor antigen p53-like [Oscarella lobularis]|uniref:cellular tumor antigen p53-like n=1 Tax=Oscarella lobularis TaxID=121494 RepID=UPI0033134FB2
MHPSVSFVRKENRVEFTISTTLSQAASQAPVTEEYLLDPFLGIPSNRPFPGVHNFRIKFPKDIGGESKSIPWTYSSVLNKFFVKNLKNLPVCFTTNQGLRAGEAKLRMMPAFKKMSYVREPVTRCPNHMQQNEDGHPNPLHVFKTNDSNAEYVMEANRPCIVLPFQASAVTGEATYFFASACFSSCLPGSDQEGCQLIFTLEINGRIIGRDTVDVRVCSCPGRDKIMYVKKFLKQTSASNGDDVARQAKILREPPPDSDSEPEGNPVKIRQRCSNDSKAKRECVEEDSDSETVYYVAVRGKHRQAILSVYENLRLLDRLVNENSKVAERDRNETREMQRANGLAALQPANGQDLSQQELSGSSVGSSNGSQSQSRPFHYSLTKVVSFQ